MWGHDALLCESNVGGTTFRRGALSYRTVCEGAKFRRGRAVLHSPVRSRKFCGVIPEIDIWRAATLMLRRYGERVLEETHRAPTSSDRPAMTTISPCGAGSRLPEVLVGGTRIPKTCERG
jgi:hypothetical protein